MPAGWASSATPTEGSANSAEKRALEPFTSAGDRSAGRTADRRLSKSRPVCYREIMRILATLATTIGLVHLAYGVAGAQCSSATCTDLDAIDNVRAVISSACDCAGANSHRAYVKCAKDVIRSAIKNATLQNTCKKSVLKCEARSTCGREHAKICCVKSPKGKVKALAVRSSKCPRQGQLCDHPMALADACTSDGACAKRKGIRSFASVQKVFHTSCALPSCHSTFQRKGELVLETEDLSYKSLVGRPAAHPEATDRIRVVPGDPASSYLVQKLRGQGPGDPMPQAGNE